MNPEKKDRAPKRTLANRPPVVTKHVKVIYNIVVFVYYFLRTFCLQFVLCTQCLRSLTGSNVSKPPKYAVANGLFIGQLPEHLQGMTVSDLAVVSRTRARSFPRK